MIVTTPSCCEPTVAAQQHAFLSILPTIQQHAAVAFRWTRCPHEREDLRAEVVAIAWARFIQIQPVPAQQSQLANRLAQQAISAVRRGHRLVEDQSAEEVTGLRG